MEVMRKGEYQYRDGTPMFCPYCNYEYNAYYVYAHFKDIFTCEKCKEQSWVDVDCKRKHDTENKSDCKYSGELCIRAEKDSCEVCPIFTAYANGYSKGHSVACMELKEFCDTCNLQSSYKSVEENKNA